MKDTDRQNKQERPDASRDSPVTPYTPEQRRMIQKGLRIWARVAIRSYMKRHGAAPDGSHPAPDEGGEEEG